MRTRIASTLTLLSVALSLLAAPPAAQAAWVWTPQHGWTGPSGPVLETPEAQLEYALELFEAREYEEAETEFRKLLKAYKESREAAEAQYYLGRSEEEQGNYYKAYEQYLKTIQTYPSTAHIEEIFERMYRIGNYFLGGGKRKAFGKFRILPGRGKAIEIFESIVEEGPFSEYGPLAQYKLGMAHFALDEYEAAIEAFDELITRYPESDLADDARYQMAMASLRGTFKPGYDQSATDIAIDQLEGFLENYPHSEMSAQAREQRRELIERRAAHEFMIADFYRRRKKPEAAKLYYETVVRDYPLTSWAPKAVARLESLGTE